MQRSRHGANCGAIDNVSQKVHQGHVDAGDTKLLQGMMLGHKDNEGNRGDKPLSEATKSTELYIPNDATTSNFRKLTPHIDVKQSKENTAKGVDEKAGLDGVFVFFSQKAAKGSNHVAISKTLPVKKIKGESHKTRGSDTHQTCQ